MTGFLALASVDGESDARFDRIARLARRIFHVDAAQVVLFDGDREWVISHAGGADCSEERAAGLPFRIGQPIHGPQGTQVGALCIIGQRPPDLSDEDEATLRDLAGVVADEIAVTQTGTTDELTGLANRRGFDLVARKLLEVCRRAGRHAVLIFADLDGLKRINDVAGHIVGDRALVEFARTLEETYRSSDVVARLGGDEFAVLLTATGAPDPGVDKLHGAIDEVNRVTRDPFVLSVSVGVAHFRPDSDETLDGLVDRADTAMYEDKHRR